VPEPRARIKRAALRAGVGVPLRALKRRLEPAHVRLDRADHARLRALLAEVLRPASSALDVGCHEGVVLAEIVRVAPNGRHVAWEPLPELADRTAARFPGVEVRRAALSDRPGERDFVHVTTLPGWSGFRARPYPGRQATRTIRVRTERLDDALPEGCVPALVKIDVEGAELEVLRGGLQTIARHRPVVVFEHGRGSADHYGTAPADVWELLAGHAGLRVYGLDGAGPFTLGQFEDEFARGERVNFVARP
jgi:FkbM family methyltransferase